MTVESILGSISQLVFLITTSIMIIGSICLFFYIFKNKGAQEFYTSLENILSKLGNNETNKQAIMGAIAKAMNDAEKDGTGKLSHRSTKMINTVIKKIGSDQYELAALRSFFSSKFLIFLLIIIISCIFNILVLFDYVSPSVKFWGKEINFQYELAFKAITIAITFLMTDILWTAIKITSRKVYNYAMDKFKNLL